MGRGVGGSQPGAQPRGCRPSGDMESHASQHKVIGGGGGSHKQGLCSAGHICRNLHAAAPKSRVSEARAKKEPRDLVGRVTATGRFVTVARTKLGREHWPQQCSVMWGEGCSRARGGLRAWAIVCALGAASSLAGTPRTFQTCFACFHFHPFSSHGGQR